MAMHISPSARFECSPGGEHHHNICQAPTPFISTLYNLSSFGLSVTCASVDVYRRQPAFFYHERSCLYLGYGWQRNVLLQRPPSPPFPSHSWLSMPSTLLQVFTYILIRSLLAVARSTNRTIDDTFGDSVTQLQVTYTSNWHVGQTCSVCAVSPNRAQAYGGTWHDTTSNNPNSTAPHSASFRFNGSSYFLIGSSWRTDETAY